MTAALALLLGAVAGGWLIPRRLRRADLRYRDPRSLIVAWVAAIAGVAASGIAGVLVLLAPGHGQGGSLAWAVNGCLRALQDGVIPRLHELIGVASAGLLAVLVGRFMVIGSRELLRLRRDSRTRLEAMRIVGRPDPGAPDTLWLAHERPLAFSIRGRPSMIVGTEGLHRHLPVDGVAAVLAHERAHLRGRHHLLLALTDVLGRTLPFVPLFRQAPAAMRELVELAADTSAARVCGAAAVRSALVAVAGHDAPGTALAMGRDTVHLRLARLEHVELARGRTRRALSCGAAGALATSVPLFASVTLLLAVTVVACPIAGT